MYGNHHMEIILADQAISNNPLLANMVHYLMRFAVGILSKSFVINICLPILWYFMAVEKDDMGMNHLEVSEKPSQINQHSIARTAPHPLRRPYFQPSGATQTTFLQDKRSQRRGLAPRLQATCVGE